MASTIEVLQSVAMDRDYTASFHAAIERKHALSIYCCRSCGGMRQVECSKPAEYRRQPVLCECGSIQDVHLFP